MSLPDVRAQHLQNRNDVRNHRNDVRDHRNDVREHGNDMQENRNDMRKSVDVMGSRSFGRVLPAFALLALTAGAAGCGGQAETAEETEVRRVVNVEVTDLVTEDFAASIKITGSVEALQDIDIVPEEAGVVDVILAEKGERVVRGRVLIRLDAEVLSAQLEEARASASLAQEQWQRQKRLWEEEKIGSEMDYIQARENARMQAARVRTLETRLEKRSIRSPIDGTFEDYYVEVGELAAPPSPVARVLALDRVKITGGVPERFANDVAMGTEVGVSFDAFPDRDLTARVSFVGDAVERQARTFPVEMVISNPRRRLKPGMIASLNIVRQRIEEAVVVPQEAVVRTQDGYQVFVVEEDEQGRPVARARRVVMGPSRANRVVITEGLDASDRLVTVGQLKLGDGDLVNIVSSGGGEEQ